MASAGYPVAVIFCPMMAVLGLLFGSPGDFGIVSVCFGSCHTKCFKVFYDVLWYLIALTINYDIVLCITY